jgi:hypothetical protein
VLSVTLLEAIGPATHPSVHNASARLAHELHATVAFTAQPTDQSRDPILRSISPHVRVPAQRA